MRMILLVMTVVMGLAIPTQAQNVVDGFGVNHWVGGGVGRGGNFTFTKKTEPNLANEIKWWGAIAVGGGSIIYHEYNKAKMSREMYEAAEKLAKLGMVEITPTSVRLTPFGLATAQKLGYSSVAGYPDPVSQKRIEDWNGRDWGDPEIQEMKREARRLEEKADAIERYIDAQRRLEEARQYREVRRPVAAAKPVSEGSEKKIEELEKKLDMLLQKSQNGSKQQQPKIEIEKMIPQSNGRVPLPDPLPDKEKARPEGTFNWQPTSPASPKVVLAGLTPEEKEFFGKNDEGKGLVVTETFNPNPLKRKILQKDEEGNWRQVN